MLAIYRHAPGTEKSDPQYSPTNFPNNCHFKTDSVLAAARALRGGQTVFWPGRWLLRAARSVVSPECFGLCLRHGERFVAVVAVVPDVGVAAARMMIFPFCLQLASSDRVGFCLAHLVHCLQIE